MGVVARAFHDIQFAPQVSGDIGLPLGAAVVSQHPKQQIQINRCIHHYEYHEEADTANLLIYMVWWYYVGVMACITYDALT